MDSFGRRAIEAFRPTSTSLNSVLLARSPMTVVEPNTAARRTNRRGGRMTLLGRTESDAKAKKPV